jgi:hypothetical protein
MKSKISKIAPALTALVLAAMVVPLANAQCGVMSKLAKPTSWNLGTNGAHLTRAAFEDDQDRDDASIVGMWHVVFTAHTQNGESIPGPGVVFDNSLVTWHSDGTEIMNSSRPAQDGNFCMGVWEKTGKRSYFLNHIPWQGNDPSNAPTGIGNPSGGAQLLETINLSADGNHYTGTFSFVAYDTTGAPGPSFTGTLTATRVTTHTPFSNLL